MVEEEAVDGASKMLIEIGLREITCAKLWCRGE